MKPYVSHEELLKFAIAILEKMGYKELKLTSNRYDSNCKIDNLIPDIYNDEICVEVGNLNLSNFSKTTNDSEEAYKWRMKQLLKKFEKIFWFPYPEVVFGVPFFKIMVFESFEENITDKLKTEIRNLEKKIMELKNENERIEKQTTSRLLEQIQIFINQKRC